MNDISYRKTRFSRRRFSLPRFPNAIPSLIWTLPLNVIKCVDLIKKKKIISKKVKQIKNCFKLKAGFKS